MLDLNTKVKFIIFHRNIPIHSQSHLRMFLYLCNGAEIMMSQAECCCQNSKYEEGLRLCLILDVICNRIGNEQCSLKVNLGQNECQNSSCVGSLANCCKITCNTQLSQCDGSGTNPLGTVNSKCYGE